VLCYTVCEYFYCNKSSEFCKYIAILTLTLVSRILWRLWTLCFFIIDKAVLRVVDKPRLRGPVYSPSVSGHTRTGICSTLFYSVRVPAVAILRGCWVHNACWLWVFPVGNSVPWADWLYPPPRTVLPVGAS